MIHSLLAASGDVIATPMLIAAVRAHAWVNYGKGEWNLIAEAYTDQEISVLVMGATGEKQAIGMVRRYLSPIMSVDVVYQRAA